MGAKDKEKQLTFRLTPAGMASMDDLPELIVAGGPFPYLWVGSRRCVGVLDDSKTLRKLAQAILDALKKSRKKG